MPFTIYPAIDLRDGQVVRLQYGNPDRQTTFSSDPVATAQQWLDGGATWLHIVNLDGAFDEKGTANWAVLPHLTALPAHVQFGGGVRSLADVEQVLHAGVARVILGTAAVENPDLVSQAVTRFGLDHIAVGIDARDGLVKTRGWQTGTAVTPTQLGQQMKERGVQTVIYTDISRDGVMTGVNAEATAQLAQATGLSVIAAGGVASLEDVQRCHALAKNGIGGVIIGRALYDGKVVLHEAIKWQTSR
jgi:phosphoribosylformimino-5-aminoimidazole carboxamide ribotide isomerase